jgi:glycosyltransferase involved in cell wall biosynthesis
MRIAVDTKFLPANEVHDYFIKKLFCRLAKVHKDHQFIFFLDKPIDALPALPLNVTPVVITPEPTNFILYKWWYDVKVPSALKKHKADVFICTYGLCSLHTKIPQLLIVHNLSFLHDSVFFPKNSLSFYKKYTLQFLRTAAVIATFSDFVKKEISGKYAISQQQIIVIETAAPSSFKPLLWEEREKVKEQYAQGCEYFVLTGSIQPLNNLINLLKAFSIFKKWQKTNMKLVIAVKSEEYKAQSEKLKSYKYKNDIHLAENLSLAELAQLTAGAYAMIFTPLYEGFGQAVLEAMQCEVPVITSIESSMAEIAGDAALYADPAKPEEIAEQMKQIFKDEKLRNKLVAAGKERIKLYNWNKTIALTWQAIEKAVSR